MQFYISIRKKLCGAVLLLLCKPNDISSEEIFRQDLDVVGSEEKLSFRGID